MEPFVYAASPSRVVFERGARRVVAREVERLGCQRPAVVCTPGHKSQAMEIYALLGEAAVGVIDTARMHTPVEVTEAAVGQVRQWQADCLVAVGGGSTIGLAKAIALHTGLPQVAVPTTYAGSEMTAVVGQTVDGVKTTQRDPALLPATVLYDVDFTLSMPGPLSATSGMNAVAHAVEALYAPEKNPVSTMQCLEAIRVLARALPAVVADPDDLAARQQAQYGAFLCGLVLGNAGMALHHKLCHTLGGRFDLPHAPTHTVMLPHVAAFNAVAVDGALEPVAQMLGSGSVGAGLWDLARGMEAPTSLAALGMNEADLDEAADLATERPYWNPRKTDRDAIRQLLQDAFDGRRPD